MAFFDIFYTEKRKDKRRLVMNLKIELVPTSAKKNLRTKMKKAEWRALSRFVRVSADFTCEYCGQRFDNLSDLDTHEVWGYKKKKKHGKVKYIQYLKDITCICKKCHAVKHIGFAAHNGTYEEAVEQFLRVNDCGYLTFKRHENKAYFKNRKRNKYKWKLKVNIDKVWDYVKNKYGDI